MEATNRRADPTAAEPVRPLAALEAALQTVLEGQERTIRLSLACLLARGHLLLEDAPGTGKTTLSRAMARAAGLEFRRVQMTADMMPSDITGARYPAAELDRTAHGSHLLGPRTASTGPGSAWRSSRRYSRRRPASLSERTAALRE